MFDWCETWDPFGGLCSYHCRYCYVWEKIGPWLARMSKAQGRIPKYEGYAFLVEKELEIPLISDLFIFVQDLGDIMNPCILTNEIMRVYAHCREYEGQNAGYLTLTKNPARLKEFLPDFPESMLLGITLETNGYADPEMSGAPSPEARYEAFRKLKWNAKMVSIEPIMDFDLEVMVKWLKKIKPQFVSIGANSIRKVNLPEPPTEKISELIRILPEFTEVRLKKNLQQIRNPNPWKNPNPKDPVKYGLLQWCD